MDPADGTSRGAHIAKYAASGPLSNPYTFAPGRGPVSAAGSDAPGSSGEPVWPWLSPREVAERVIAYVAGADLELFATARDRDLVLGKLADARASILGGAYGAAAVDGEAARGLLDAAVANGLTRFEMKGLVGALVASIEQQMGNRPPVPVAPSGSFASADGVRTRAVLDARRSTDPDSTRGTSDNIRSYRWLDARGNPIADGPVVVLTLPEDLGQEGPPYVVTLEVEDAYGGRAQAPVAIQVVPESQEAP